MYPDVLRGSGSYCRIEQRPAHRAHNPEDGGSNPSPAFRFTLIPPQNFFLKAHLVEIQGVFFCKKDKEMVKKVLTYRTRYSII